MVLSDQLTDLFENIFHTFLCAFRKGHGYQTTLLRLLEDWKTALDKNQYVAAILMVIIQCTIFNKIKDVVNKNI
jgi:hypothetical protein